MPVVVVAAPITMVMPVVVVAAPIAVVMSVVSLLLRVAMIVAVACRRLLVGTEVHTRGRLHECDVADANEVAVHSCGDTVPAVPLEAGHLRQCVARRHEIADAALVTRDEAASERVRILLLDGRRPAVQRLLWQLSHRLHPQKLKLASGECAGLVEPDGADARERFEGRRALHQKPVASGQQRERCPLHKRRRTKQGAGAAGDDDDQELFEALVDAKGDRKDEDGWCVPRGEFADDRFRLRERALRFGHGVRHSRLEGGRDRHLGLYLHETHRHERSRRDLVTLAFGLR